MKHIAAFAVFVFCAGILTRPAAAQSVEQVWPPDSAGALADVVVCDSRTIVAFGANDAILQSDDAGRHWRTIRWGRGEWNFYRAVKTDAGVFVLGQAAAERRPIFPEGDDIRLMRYDPASQLLIPCFSPPISHLTEYASIEAIDGALFLLRQESRGDASLWWSPDGTMSWKEIPLPAKMYHVWEMSLFGRSVTELGCIMRDSLAVNNLFVTTDGGQNWRAVGGLRLELERHQSLFHLAGAAAQWTADNTIILTAQAKPPWYETYEFAVSTDAGATWHRRAVRPEVALRIFARDSGSVYYTDLLRNVYRSRDGCRSFQLVKTGSAKRQHEYVSQHYDDLTTGLDTDGSGLLACCDRRGNLSVSADDGDTWVQGRTNLLDLEDFTMFDDNRGLLKARDLTTNRMKMYSTMRGGRSWEERCDLDSAGLSSVRFVTPALIFALPPRTGPDSAAVFRSTDGGRSWTCVCKDRQYSGSYSFIASGADTSFVAVLSETGILITTDAGASWGRFPRHRGGSLRWLSPSGLGWISESGDIWQSWLDLTHGFWSSQYRVLETEDTFVEVRAFSDLEAIVVGCRHVWKTATGGETWETGTWADCNHHRVWSTRDGRGINLFFVQATFNPRYWQQDHVFVTHDGWMHADLAKIWYSADIGMIDSYAWSAPSSAPAQYMLTDHRILRVPFDAVNRILPPPAAHPLTIGIPRPHPAAMGTTCIVDVYADQDPGETALRVFDLRGRQLREVYPETCGSGSAQYRLPTEGLQPGCYLLRIDSGGHSATRPMLIF